MGDSEAGNCGVCGAKDVPIVRTYFHYDIKCDCHSPNHFEIRWHCPTCIPEEPKSTVVTMVPKRT